jgi:hypothetical protein
LGGCFLQKVVGGLEENAGPIAGVGFGAGGSAMAEVGQDGQGVADDGVGLLPFNVDDEADAAGVALKLGIVEALGCRGNRAALTALLVKNSSPPNQARNEIVNPALVS